MIEKIFYQSSLPRSGSTLFQNLMGQNPDFYVTPTSGLLELIYGARSNYSNNPEFKAQEPSAMKKAFLNFCRNGMLGYAGGLTDKPYFLDKSRGWGIHYNWLNEIFDKPKIVCMIRDLRDIMCSMEKKFRSNPDKQYSFINWETGQGVTTESRMDVWLNSPPVGLAMTRIYEMWSTGTINNILVIKFEDLCLYPDITLRKVYEYFELDFSKYEKFHNFENVEQITQEDDKVYGVFGDHKIRTKITPMASDAKKILGPEICKWIEQKYSWYFKAFGYK